MTTDIRVAAAEAQAARPPDAVQPPQRPPPPGRGRARETRRRAGTVLTWVALCLLGIVFMYPFVWLVSASFKPRSEVFDNRLIPETFTFDNYVQVWQEAPLALWLLNTAIVTVLAAVTVTISSAMVAWGFAYFRFRGRGFLFGLVLATMMLPGAVTMIPTFLIWNALGQVGTLTPLWAGNLFGSAFYIFLLRQFFLGLPARPLRGGPHRRREPVGRLLADRAAADRPGARRGARVRGAGGVDRPDEGADLPARLRHLHHPAGPQVARGRVRLRRRVALGDHHHRERHHDRPADHRLLPRAEAHHRRRRVDRAQRLGRADAAGGCRAPVPFTSTDVTWCGTPDGLSTRTSRRRTIDSATMLPTARNSDYQFCRVRFQKSAERMYSPVARERSPCSACSSL